MLQIAYSLILTHIRNEAREQQRINNNWELDIDSNSSNTNNGMLDNLTLMPDEDKGSSTNNENSNKTTLNDLINTPSETNSEIYDNTNTNGIIEK